MKKCSPLCKPFIAEITREIPLKTKKTLLNIEKTDLEKMRDKVVEFCEYPQSVYDIKQFTKLDTTIDSVRRYLINPLMKEGRIKYLYPDNPARFNQKYISAKVEITKDLVDKVEQESDKLTQQRNELIMDFCKVPRGIKEIEKCIGSKNARQYTSELVKEGKLRYLYPDIKYCSTQKYINAEIQWEILTDDAVIEYCKEPRTKSEIQNHFKIKESMRKGIVNRLLKDGKLCYTEDSMQMGEYDGNRRLIKNG